MKKAYLIILFIITLLLLVIISFKAFNNISTFKEHRTYIKQPIENQSIQEWMTLNYIEKRFSIDLNKAFQTDISLLNKSITLKDYCTKNNLNCEDFIISLEKYRNGY